MGVGKGVESGVEMGNRGEIGYIFKQNIGAVITRDDEFGGIKQF